MLTPVPQGTTVQYTAMPSLSPALVLSPALSPVPLCHPACPVGGGFAAVSVLSVLSVFSVLPPLRAGKTREGRCPSREASALMRAATLRQAIFDSSLAGA